MERPSKTDSAPVRGDGYEPESLTQSQRRDVAQRAIGPGGGCKRWGGGEKFSYGMVRSQKPPLTVPLTTTATTLFPY